jgi:hypothetical protein
MPSPQPSEIAVPSITREVLSTQGLIKGVGSKKKYMQQPKPKKGYMLGESGKVQKTSDIKMREQKMGEELSKIAAARKKMGGPANLSDWPSTSPIQKSKIKGLYNKSKNQKGSMSESQKIKLYKLLKTIESTK